MVFEKLRLLCAVLAWLAAGFLAASAGASPRGWTGVAVLALLGVLLIWPLLRARAPMATPPESPTQPDAKRLLLLQTQLEHLPVAAWVQTGDQALLPLSNRARRLAAPGAIRDFDALCATLQTSSRSGPLVLDTERGSERWQLQRQPLSLDGCMHTLYVLIPLESELESESLLAWQQLTSVLTHEIMNSLTPIKSLSETARGMLEQPGGTPELRLALDAIARRAGSLSTFVQNYRRVSKWPAPTLEAVDLQGMFDRLRQAVAPGWEQRGGEVRFELGSLTLRLMADEGQLEQALLALLKNAEEATVGVPTPRLWVTARVTRGDRLQIGVRDNGPGVAPGLERKIFLPFFSARDGGQGIGLTVVRQLVSGMGGRVRHLRPLEGGAEFVLSF